ncbi:hypothetical protein [Pseudonocardia sp. GCM10023141]|uniref:hypothetical protein n=1 Tax=Pseudonocardia sp. GCM10023141 TaxID=3252653 RepID=UPI00361F4885
MTQLPSDATTSAPRGTPPASRSRAADLWCAHGIRWTHDDTGYLPTVEDTQHPAVPCREAGALPEECQPTTAHDPAEFPDAGPQGVRAVLEPERR